MLDRHELADTTLQWLCRGSRERLATVVIQEGLVPPRGGLLDRAAQELVNEGLLDMNDYCKLQHEALRIEAAQGPVSDGMVIRALMRALVAELWGSALVLHDLPAPPSPLPELEAEEGEEWMSMEPLSVE